ncbi:MAG: ThiF family adenylyltransferase [Thermoprotei archaeon]
MRITPALLERFSRQVLVPEIGVKGLKKLRESRIVVLGCGATGTAQAEILARMGIGFIRVVDQDYVDLSNLPRTRLFTEKDAEKALPKAIACANRIREIDPTIEVEPVIEKIGPNNIEKLIRDVDIVIDGLDNLHTRFIVNDACVKLGKPWVFVGFASWYGNTILIDPNRGPCFRCIVPVKMLEREERGDACEILGAVYPAISLLTSISATLVIKHLLGLTSSSDYETLYIINGKDLSIEKITIKKNPNCLTCRRRIYEFIEKREARNVARICGSNAVEINPPKELNIDFEKLAKNISRRYNILAVNPYTIKIKISDTIYMILFRNGRAVIDGIIDVDKARSIYDDVMRLYGESERE